MKISKAIICHIFCSITILTSDVCFSQKNPDQSGKDPTSDYLILESLFMNPGQTAEVENLTFQKDAATFSLRNGTLTRLTTAEGRTVGALFIGKATLTVVSPTDVERKQFYRFFESETLSVPLESIFMLFTEATENGFLATLEFGSSELPKGTQDALKRAKRFLMNYYETGYRDEFIRPFLYADQQGFFYAHCLQPNLESFFFKIDPYEVEEVSLSRNYKHLVARNSVQEIISMFHASEEYHNPPLDLNETKKSVDVQHYDIQSEINTSLELQATCAITLRPVSPGRKWIHGRLFEELAIDSIVRTSGQKLAVVRPEKTWDFWIYSPEPFSTSSSDTLTFYYRGEVIRREEGWFSLKSSTGWYPKFDDTRDRATFDLRFTTPAKYQFVSVGQTVASDRDGDVVRSRWVLDLPSRNASFMLGNFRGYKVETTDVPPITVYLATAHDASLRAALSSIDIGSGSDMEEQVGNDLRESVRFCQSLYGKNTMQQFSAAEIPYGYGEAFPGLLHLSWTTFQNTNRDGSDEVFRAHEVAHQWWAVGVDFKTYHDQWLSEAFSEYTGLWYMQIVLKNNEKFFRKLSNYREDIVSNRKYLFSDGQAAGPVWLGYRNQTADTEGDYSTIVYKKGAWVLHMLRNMALDLKTMKEDIFEATMKDFYTSYVGKEATTEDFRRIIEKHYRVDMGWFFKQWVYNTDIPVYNITYSLQEQPGAKYAVRCLIKQTGVPDDFQMTVPLYIDFGENRFARIRILVKGPLTDYTIPGLPIKPKDIKFNDLESVLCTIDDEDWD